MWLVCLRLGASFISRGRSLVGFYYDFYREGEKIQDKDLKKIKKEMDKIISKDLPIMREEVSREEARRR